VGLSFGAFRSTWIKYRRKALLCEVPKWTISQPLEWTALLGGRKRRAGKRRRLGLHKAPARPDSRGMTKSRAAPRVLTGRPANPHGAARGAPVVTLRLDSETEAALTALSAEWGHDAHGARPELARRAIVKLAMRECQARYRLELERVRARREGER